MSVNSSDNQDKDYGDVWRKVYRSIALILLIPVFLYVIHLLLAVVGI